MLNFPKTAVWTLIVLSCWKLLLKCFVSTHQQFHILNWQLWIRLLNWIIYSFVKKLETKLANFQKFKQRCFMNSLRSSERMLLMSFISVSSKSFFKINYQLALVTTGVISLFTHLIFSLDHSLGNWKAIFPENRCLDFDCS